MANFFQELKRRNVLRGAGLYIGIGFMLIEAGSILLPLYGYSDDTFRIWVFIVIAGFPFVAIGSWFFEITTSGILTDEEAQQLQASPLISRRKVDYVIAGVLVAALITSLTLNYATFQQAEPGAAPTSLSILISDFSNSTKESLFTGTLEEALQIGVEGASFISSFSRKDALAIAQNINPDLQGLDAEHARLVAVRESVDLVLSGDAKPDGSGFELYIAAIDPTSGETLLESSVSAASKLDVLQAISDLATDVREQLGDVQVNEDDYVAESLSASNIEAVSAYVTGQSAASERRFVDAIPHYKKAIELDPNLGRAYSGWALAATEIGQSDEAMELWEKTISLLDTMSTRERFRTLGLYYAVANQDYDKAVDAFQELVDSYPADTAGYNNLAVASFQTLDFDAAQAAGAKALKHYPQSVLYRANYALYAMYAGDLETAAVDARNVIIINPDYPIAYLPIAIHAALNNQIEEARDAYEGMRKADPSRADHGLADLDIFSGNFDSAANLLEASRATDIAGGNQFSARTKTLMLAGIAAMTDQPAKAEALVADNQLTNTEHLIHAISILLTVQADENAIQPLRDKLAGRLQRQPRAYAAGVDANLVAPENFIKAIDLFREGLALADLWWLRVQLGKVYLEHGYHTEALTEFETATRRLAEGAVIYLDDRPSLRGISELPLMLGQTQAALGMSDSASENITRFLTSQTGSGRAASIETARAALEGLVKPI